MIGEVVSSLPDVDVLSSIVARVMRVDDVTTGDPKKNYMVRYRGEIYGDSVEAYDRLAELLKPYKLTPLFRRDQDQHAVLLIPGLNEPKASGLGINVVLFLLTLFSVILAGAIYSYDGPESQTAVGLLQQLLHALPSGIPFAVSLLAILVAHESGHYLAGRYHKTMVTLPYFIPFPLSPFGTLGAFINMKEPPRNKRILLDIGMAGPIAGLVVTIPVLLYGLSISHVEPFQSITGATYTLEGNSLLYLLAKYLVFGKLLPAPASYGGVSPLLYWLRYFFTSKPLPFGGLDVIISPVAWAGWAGLLVTALNLIPAGQLDGGHAMYVLLGQRTRLLWPFIMLALVALGFVWSGWWLWALLIFLLGRSYAEPLDQITQLDPKRKMLAVLGIIIFILVFIPVPLVIVSGAGV